MLWVRQRSLDAWVEYAAAQGCGAGSASRVGEVLEEVELRDDAEGVAVADHEDRVGASRQEAVGLVDAGTLVDLRERPTHDLTDRSVDDARVAVRSIEEGSLAHGPDEALERGAIRRLRHRHLADAEALEVFDRLADALRGSGDHEDRKSTRLNSSHIQKSRMPSSA